ncbi:uncharacterized protein LOC117182216 isoform X2 [Belonocnema kinseyi]|uniref:uncharacterized protein LOC117182216 isoform X2 n=1 Tax=Belonocnema kinseyi TaxID=2817044 RepID=UPI00143DE018|nr:uncharacterized protein LOC117182216 isoform X2 [Belonocnema kinseyi]
MEKVYTSCIKINGVPILPPLMTQELREEMHYYKQLARAVGEKLKEIHLAKEVKEPNEKIVMSNVDDSFNSEIECESLDVTPNRVFTTDYPAEMENIEITEKTDTKDAKDSCNRTFIGTWGSISDEENADQNETEIENNTSSDTVSFSTDLNHYLNESTETSIRQDQLKKPQVPKILDIIPVLDKDLSPFNACKEASKVSEIREETPKLIRRGSYVLDSPSPMLLAQLQLRKANTEYVPTPMTNVVKRKEWNISQAKAEWESQLKNNELFILNSLSSRMGFKLRRNSVPNVYNQKIYSTIYHSRSIHSFELPQQAKSVDCIQTMLSNETALCDKRCNVASHTRKCDASYRQISNDSEETYREKLGRYLIRRSLENVESQYLTRNESLQENESSCSESYDYKIPKSNKIQSTIKSNSSVTFEKIVCIFKKVQEQHKKRMSALIAQQYREQVHLEQDFKRQEKHLIAEIKKAFPGLSISSLVNSYSNIENEAPRNTRTEKLNSSHSKISNSPYAKVSKSLSSNISYSPCSNKSLSPCYSKANVISSPSSKISNPRSAHSAVERCPLERISLNKFVRSVSCHQMSNQCTQTAFPESPSSGSSPISRMQIIKSLEDTFSQEEFVAEQRHSAVSRTLFPLESKSTLVPVVDNTFYSDKHNKASTTINSYARGYLVRRLLKTEHVNALKNTYKEAIKCMLKLHVDAPLNLSELKFHQRLQLQCDAASMNIVDIFSRSPIQRMKIIAHDRELKKIRTEKPNSAISYSFATQRTLARKKLKEIQKNRAHLHSVRILM